MKKTDVAEALAAAKKASTNGRVTTNLIRDVVDKATGYDREKEAEKARISKEADERIKRVLTNDPMMGIFRHADAGYDIAQKCADEQGVKIPMRE